MGRKKKFPYIVCKPCWELKYCPYGPLVEQFPLFPEMQEIEEVKSKYRTVLANLGNGKYKSEEEILSVMQILGGYSPSKWERIIDYDTVELGCNVFGHICPVFLTAEPFTETKEIRRVSRHIPRNVMLKVVRRDGHICQICRKNVPENEIEFDHIIPFSKGGASTIENLRVLCSDCNAKKSNSLNEILDDNHLKS